MVSLSCFLKVWPLQLHFLVNVNINSKDPACKFILEYLIGSEVDHVFLSASSVIFNND